MKRCNEEKRHRKVQHHPPGLATNVFRAHGTDVHGAVVFRRELSRAHVPEPVDV